MDDEQETPRLWTRREQIVILALAGLLVIGLGLSWADRAGWLHPAIRVVPSGDYQFHLDLNQATDSQLQLLPGIGPKRARQIVEYRNAHGPFRSVDDLKKVKGLSSLRLDDIRTYVTVGLEPASPAAQRPKSKAQSKSKVQNSKQEG